MCKEENPIMFTETALEKAEFEEKVPLPMPAYTQTV